MCSKKKCSFMIRKKNICYLNIPYKRLTLCVYKIFLPYNNNLETYPMFMQQSCLARVWYPVSQPDSVPSHYPHHGTACAALLSTFKNVFSKWSWKRGWWGERVRKIRERRTTTFLWEAHATKRKCLPEVKEKSTITWSIIVCYQNMSYGLQPIIYVYLFISLLIEYKTSPLGIRNKSSYQGFCLASAWRLRCLLCF